MTREEATDKARECVASAGDEARAGLLARGRRLVKHSSVRAAVHRDLVKPGLLSEEMGRLYDRLFHDRQQGDYIEFVPFDGEEVSRTIEEFSGLLRAMEALSSSRGNPD